MRKLILFLLISISTTNNQALAINLKLGVDSIVQNLETGSKLSITHDQVLTLTEQNPFWIESPGRIPIILVPVGSQSSVVKINSPNATQVFREDKDLKIDEDLSDVLLKVSEIQSLIYSKNLTLAAQKNIELKSKYPGVKYLDFIDATISFLQGDRERALASLNSALKSHPQYEPGLKLKDSLENGSNASARKPATTSERGGK